MQTYPRPIIIETSSKKPHTLNSYKNIVSILTTEAVLAKTHSFGDAKLTNLQLLKAIVVVFKSTKVDQNLPPPYI